MNGLLQACPFPQHGQHAGFNPSAAADERQAAALNAEAHSGEVMAESAILGALGDSLGTFQEIRFAQAQVQQNYQTASHQVRQTFQRVEQLAIKYGATIKRP